MLRSRRPASRASSIRRPRPHGSCCTCTVRSSSPASLCCPRAPASSTRSRPRAGPATTPTWAGFVNINTADAAALETLPGIGPALAGRIIAWRDANGGFRAVDELLAVSGIGQKTLDGFRDQVTV